MEIYKKRKITKTTYEFGIRKGVGHNPVNISVIFWKYLNLNLKFIEFKKWNYLYNSFQKRTG